MGEPATETHEERRRVLMCPPEYYEITGDNPWTPEGAETDRDAAMSEWELLRRTYESFGHQIEVIEARPGLTQMVFAANGALAIEGQAFVARFHSEERAGERQAHQEWFRDAGYDVRLSEATSEGEGDFLLTRRFVLAGTGFRTAQEAHFEAQQFFARPVVSLQLIDEKFYHLDTALCVLDGDTIAYYPKAFSADSRRLLERLFPDAIIATDHDAHQLGLNSWSDGRHVVIHGPAEDLAQRLADRGYEPVTIDMPQLQQGGGGPKCCTMGLYEQVPGH
ncbi:arginine deiminase-related protein [Actinomadura fulvescens]|uniref:Amidinotransferase n=1 Tax=Actinomadura fulvescens TaxID=46160 RepID=A0ABN3PF10_9ACTN